jgi:hypothetical protein
MVVAVVLLWTWTCAMPVLPPQLQQQPDKNAVRQEFVEPWLAERMAKETAERLEQVQRVLEEQPTARDAERQEFLRRWLALRMAREKADADAR